MPITRKGAMKRRPISIKGVSSSSSTNSDIGSSTNSGVGNSNNSESSGNSSETNNNNNFENSSNSSKTINNKSETNAHHNNNDTLYFIFIRSHGGLPYKQDPNISKRVKTIILPEDMNVYKITSAENGTTNCGEYVYDKKITDIKEKIREYYQQKLEIERQTKTQQEIQETIAKEIQTLLRTEEKHINAFTATAHKRSIISTKPFINKPYDKDNRPDITTGNPKIPVEVMFLKKVRTNKFGIENTYIFDEISKDKKKFDLQSIINWLIKYGMKNVIIMDFSCSTFSNKLAFNNIDIIKYLNNQNIHGGMYKAKSKKTKNITKTKKLKLKTKTKSKSKLLQNK